MFINILKNCCKILTVLCVVLNGFTIAAQAKRNKNHCEKFYVPNILTINYNSEPYWYQAKFGNCIDGSKVTEIPAYVLHIFLKDYKNDVREFSDFPNVTEIFLDNIKMKNLPSFIDLPSIKSISLSNNKLTKIHNKFLQRAPVKTLIFSTNQIATIEDQAFGETVEEIYLTCNNLTSISPTWFKNPAIIKQLNLGGNQLTSIPDDMFKDFVNLVHLELRNNQILTLGAGSISGPTNMIWLHLGYNNISEIKPNVFGTEIKINSMDIQYNRLSFLHQETMNKMNVKDLKIWGNPWQCPCLDVVHTWLSKNNKGFSVGLTRDEDPSCVYALSFKDRCVPFVDDELYNTFLTNFETFPIEFC